MPPISLTGIKPTGNPHIGNYFGMYKSALALTEKYLGMYFVADLHALTTTPDRKELQELRRHLKTESCLPATIE